MTTNPQELRYSEMGSAAVPAKATGSDGGSGIGQDAAKPDTRTPTITELLKEARQRPDMGRSKEETKRLLHAVARSQAIEVACQRESHAQAGAASCVGKARTPIARDAVQPQGDKIDQRIIRLRSRMCTITEIATKMNLSEAVVTKRLYRIRRAMDR